MTGGTENLASTKMTKSCTIGNANERSDGEEGDAGSVSASGSGQAKPKGEEWKKTIGAMFDSMVPLKSSKSNKRHKESDESDDDDDNGKKRRRGGGRGGGGGGPPQRRRRG